MTTAEAPCLYCREKHLKCTINQIPRDRRKPTCKRCSEKRLECIHAAPKINFRHWSTASSEAGFSQDQVWVNSKPRDWRAAPALSPPEDVQPTGQEETPLGFDDWLADRSSLLTQETQGTSESASSLGGSLECLEPTAGICQNGHFGREHGHEESYFPTNASVQESCLLRYFIEELSPLFDHCDERKHFQLVVPFRALHSSTLRNALFAVSSRHLVRRPQHTTPQGYVLYHGQLLADLKSSTAVEYMLECIPGLIQFPQTHDATEQENIMAAAVILRQYEEIEDGEYENNAIEQDFREHVNFLAITKGIIDSMMKSFSPPLDYQSLASAAYWIAIRQEVYYALTRERTFHTQFGPEDWQNASVANKLIMLVGEVAKWRWGEKSVAEWERLNMHQQYVMQKYKYHLVPILERKADRSKGDIFPTVWYTSDAQVTAIQHLELARMILIAESPHLENAPRTHHRKAESQVRNIVLNVCGIALSHLRCQPALVNAVIAITLYGEYFTEQEERDALVRIIERTRELRAWDMKKPFLTLKRRWEAVDLGEL